MEKHSRDFTRSILTDFTQCLRAWRIPSPVEIVITYYLLLQFSSAIDKFRYPAKVTHKRYGILMYAARGDTFLKDKIISMISAQSPTSQMNEKK